MDIFNVAEWCNTMMGKAKEKALEKVNNPSSNRELSNVVNLPVWPEAVRGVPNGVLRSALFGAIRRGKRKYMEREQIHSQEGVSILYTGARLDQGDLDVWECVLHLVRDQPLGAECRVNAYQLLKILGKTDSGDNRNTLDIRLNRIKATGLEIDTGRFSYTGSLIDEVYRDKETKEYVIKLNTKLHVLFAPDQFTLVDWGVRQLLDGKPLAKWVHGFYVSHAKPYPISVGTLHKLSGSESGEIWKFTQTLRRALDAVVKASNECEQSFSYEIKGDLVYVDKQPSGSQRRHLIKKLRRNISIPS